MSKAAKRPQSNKCAECGGDIEVDDMLGEAACVDCGLVSQAGLVESEDTAYHDDQVKNASDLAELRAGGDLAGGAKKFMLQVGTTCRTLRGRFNAPDAVYNDALALADEYLGHAALKSGPQQADCLAVAIFHVASLRMHFPLSQPQLIQELAATLTSANADRAVRDLVADVVAKLKIDVPASDVVLRDIVALLLGRMNAAAAAAGAPQLPQEPYLSMAAALAATYSASVTAPAEQRVIAAASIFVALTSRSAREELAPRVVAALNAEIEQQHQQPAARGAGGLLPLVAAPGNRQWEKEEMAALEKNLATLIRDNDKALRSCMKALQANGVVKTWITNATGKFPAVAARRERD
jgi:hypothetical protein